MNDIKPPLGATPYFITADQRIMELAKAIYDNANTTDKTDYGHIRTWAKEICIQCDLVKKMSEREE